jgi:AraC-like DNA-binding protein
VSARAVSVLVAEAVRLTSRTDLPLLIGARCGLLWVGACGRVARYAATLGDALEDLERAPEFHDTLGHVSLTLQGDAAHFAYVLDDPEVPHVAMIYDLALAAMCRALRELSSGAVAPYLVRLPYPRPTDYRSHREYLGPHLLFNATGGDLRFPAFHLSLPNCTANAALRRYALRDATRRIARSQPLVCVLTRKAIQKSLTQGDCSRATVSAHIGLHVRTLGRRLAVVGVTYQDLLNEEREKRARILLTQTSVGVDRVARALCFRDSTVFGRAFRRWTGVMPTDFREQFAVAANSPTAARRRRAIPITWSYIVASPATRTLLANPPVYPIVVPARTSVEQHDA